MKCLSKIAAVLLGSTLCLASPVSMADDVLLNATLPPAPGQVANKNFVPPTPIVKADAYILMDAYSGKIISQKNADARTAPASLTKMMVMYVVSGALASGQISLDDKVRVSRTAWAMDGSKMFLKNGQHVNVRDLVQGIIVDSGNDASVAMAEYIAGSEDAFVTLMNEQAKQLGMNGTHFTDATGMPDDDHYTTAYDMAILATALATHYPKHYQWYSQKWFTFNDIKQPNRNRLLWRYEPADGIKTGHTKEAGYCLAASAKQDGMRLVSVVMGSPTDNDRADSSQRLLSYGFRFYKTYKLYSAGDTITQPKVYKGSHKTTALGLANDIVVTIPRGQYNELKVTTALNDPLIAPIKKGQQLGNLNISLRGVEVASAPLYALSDVQEGGLWTRMSDSISMSIDNMFNGDDEEVT